MLLVVVILNGLYERINGVTTIEWCAKAYGSCRRMYNRVPRYWFGAGTGVCAIMCLYDSLTHV